MSVRKDVSWHLGDTWGYDVTCINGAGAEINLGAVGTQVQMRLVDPGPPRVLKATWSIGSGITIGTSPAAIQSVAQIDITDTHQTAAGVAAGKTYEYSLRVTESNGAKSTQIHGDLYVASSHFKEFA